MKMDVEQKGNVFEARLAQASTLKRVLEAMKDIVKQTNFDCNEEGISMQAMDNSHVALVSLMLRAPMFEMFSCETPMTLGISLEPFLKVLRCASNEDAVTIKANTATPDHAEFMFESPKNDRISCFEIKLMDIDAEHIALPEMEFKAAIKMPSAEYKRIVTDLSQIGENITIEVGKAGASFSVEGDIGKGNICLHATSSADSPADEIAISYEQPLSMSFALNFLLKFSKAAALSDTVELQLMPGRPLAINFSMEDETGYLCYYIAPKIGEDDDLDEDGYDDEKDEPAKVSSSSAGGKGGGAVKREPGTDAGDDDAEEDAVATKRARKEVKREVNDDDDEEDQDPDDE